MPTRKTPNGTKPPASPPAAASARSPATPRKPRGAAGAGPRAADTGFGRTDSGPANPPGTDNQPMESVEKAAAIAAMTEGMPQNPA